MPECALCGHDQSEHDTTTLGQPCQARCGCPAYEPHEENADA